ncbi:MAG TPA: hypothetical protein VL985_14075 [Stellaceae bacterium]|nr:hypothetical protein [Stellaceae bacterium]
MSLRDRYLKVLSGLVPAGAAGVSLLLGSATPVAASQEPAQLQPKAAQEARVSERLAAIREAVSNVAQQEAAARSGDIGKLRLAWGNWWRNWGWARPWGWGWPNWNNWHNWNNWPNWWRNW